ncbi:hypothetical protein BC624_10710 [Flavobacterium granuli]|uniref:Uncharacterized protein n=1 Tax=Flavobacterium granuli TaxID=280093 RepID=A0A1M5Q000_9FLAO|nr:hypothetical protein BC624_10710 [Flavobacterium granuli]SHH07121.1 hypothetical protein SAMN05443373_10710 [Flavobacterium granuli]
MLIEIISIIYKPKKKSRILGDTAFIMIFDSAYILANILV